MNSKILYFILVGLTSLLIVGLVGGAYGANYLLEGQSKKLQDAKLESLTLTEKQKQLIKAKEDIEKYQPLANIAKSVVPQDKSQAQTVREIVNIAAANGIQIASITFPSSTLGGSNVPTKSGKPSASSGSKNTGLSQLTPVKDIGGVYTLPITIQSDTDIPVSYFQFLRFLDALEHNRRTALVSSITLQPDDTVPNGISFTLIVDEYIKP